MPYDLKTEVADTSFGSGAYLVGMDSQSASRPSVYAQATVWDYWKTLANTFSGLSTFAMGTITTSKPLTISSTLNAGGVTFEGLVIDWTHTASAAASKLINAKLGNSSLFYLRKDGAMGSDQSFSAGFQLNHSSACMLVGRIADLPNAVVSLGDDGGGYSGVRVGYNGHFTWGNTNCTTSPDLMIAKSAAGVASLRGTSLTSPAAWELYTYGASAPAAPSASMARFYVDTSGGKLRLMVRFPSGAAQQVAIEP